MSKGAPTLMAAGVTTAFAASLLTAGVVLNAPTALARAVDPQTGCEAYFDSFVSGDTPIQFMRIINEIPQQVTVSRTKPGGAMPTKVQTDTTPVWLGQKTPYMDGGNTTDHKKYLQGSTYDTDYWWNKQNYDGCYTEIPFVVGPGDGANALQSTYGYDGKLYGRNDNWRGKGNWWAFPKVWGTTKGVSGFHSWTCRGPVNPDNTSSVYWKKVSEGSGFFGDNDNDRKNRDAGRAPACQDNRLKDLTIRSHFDQSYYGNLEKSVRDDMRCEVSGGSNAIGCWNELYGGPWANTWRQTTHVYGVTVRATLQSSAEIDIPIEYRQAGEPSKRRLSWVITQAENYGGTWPTGSRGLTDNTVPSGDEVTPFTVVGGLPGRTEPYQIGTWGNVNNAEQKLKFRLTATTDGTWSWPVNDQGEELLRPSVDLVFKYTLNDFNYQGKSCGETKNGKGTWTDKQPCLFGLVPTIFQVSDNIEQNERRDPLLNEKKQPISTADWRFEAVQGGWNTSDLKVQQVGDFDWGAAGGRHVGANAKWNINLSGIITNLQ
ncbi:MAG: hypothetical protein ACOYNJ_11310 [Candidatus Nanopelagicales bacterium]